MYQLMNIIPECKTRFRHTWVPKKPPSHGAVESKTGGHFLHPRAGVWFGVCGLCPHAAKRNTQ